MAASWRLLAGLLLLLTPPPPAELARKSPRGNPVGEPTMSQLLEFPPRWPTGSPCQQAGWSISAPFQNKLDSGKPSTAQSSCWLPARDKCRPVTMIHSAGPKGSSGRRLDSLAPAEPLKSNILPLTAGMNLILRRRAGENASCILISSPARPPPQKTRCVISVEPIISLF